MHRIGLAQSTSTTDASINGKICGKQTAVCHEYKGGSYEANIKFKLVCNYIRDGGRPSEIVLQEKISNYSKLLYVKSYGGER
jgi:hypothetical protein